MDERLDSGCGVTVARATTCDTCSLQLNPGARAHVIARSQLRCVACAAGVGAEPSDLTCAAMVLVPHVVRRGDTALLVAAALVGGVTLVRSATARRIATTVGVALKSAARVVWDRLRGRPRTAPAIVRRAFEDLGPTYVKLGQLVASTTGIFPEAYCEELRGCLDRVRPLPFATIERVVRRELARPLSRVFSEIDPKPLASASIAQVHAARLLDGTEVVLKVQRPGIGKTIETDIVILRSLAGVIARAGRWRTRSPSSTTSRPRSRRSSTSRAKPRA